MMTKRLIAALAMAITFVMTGTGSASASNQVEAQAQAASVRVVVNYTGREPVDAAHQVWVWLFDSPDIGPGAMPIAQMSLQKNGDELIFEGVAARQVWIAAAYDESGTMRGDGPPPTGSPIGIYAPGGGPPEPVTPGGRPSATLTFDDSVRMP